MNTISQLAAQKDTGPKAPDPSAQNAHKQEAQEESGREKSAICSERSYKLPEGMLLYAIGDIHGRLDLLRTLLEKLRADYMASPNEEESQNGAPARRKIFLFLGDYIDRGPSSREVIELLASSAHSVRSEFSQRSGFSQSSGPSQSSGHFDQNDEEFVFLKGNHEALFLNFLSDSERYEIWARNGGAQTLRSYGVAPEAMKDAALRQRCHQALKRVLPRHHVDFLENLQLSVSYGDYFFAHAGVNPDMPLELQSERDLMWIREPFLSHERPLDKMIVHGHTPSEQVQLRAHRIGVDTMAWKSGVLTALRLEGASRQIISTQPETDAAR